MYNIGLEILSQPKFRKDFIGALGLRASPLSQGIGVPTVRKFGVQTQHWILIVTVGCLHDLDHTVLNYKHQVTYIKSRMKEVQRRTVVT